MKKASFLGFLNVQILIFDATENQKIIFSQNKPSKLVEKHQITFRIQYHDITGCIGSLREAQIQKVVITMQNHTNTTFFGG